jgi:hypothetical protein
VKRQLGAAAPHEHNLYRQVVEPNR